MNSRRKVSILALIFIALPLAACSTAPLPEPLPAPVIATLPPSPTENAPAAPTTIPELESPSSVSSFPDAEQYQWTMFAEGFNQPVDIQHAGDGSGRLFIVERGGKILILEDGIIVEESFFDISKKIVTRGSERPLI